MTSREDLDKNLRSQKCPACAHEKKQGQSLCIVCFHYLPSVMRLDLMMLDKLTDQRAGVVFDQCIRYLRVHFETYNKFRKKKLMLTIEQKKRHA